MASLKTKLPLVAAGEELTGVAPPALERATKRCKPGDSTHRGLVRVCSALARPGLPSCIPPSVLSLVSPALDTADGWADEALTDSDARRVRSEVFAAASAVETKTREAVAAGRRRIDGKAHTRLDPHADSVVLRYAGLAAIHAMGSALLVLDGVEHPPELAKVPQQIAGALAYRDAGLGPARSVDLRAQAWGQAEWESSRGSGDHGVGPVAVQVLHEYLGAHWKDRSDGHRLYLAELVDWALETA